MSVSKPSFETSYPELKRIVATRRHAWTYLNVMDWEEVSHLLMIQLWTKWHLYDPTKASKGAKNPLEHWANTVITHRIANLKRDAPGGTRLSRPCIGGGKSNGKRCVFNMGGDACTFTKSRTQCSECPLYAEWEKNRQPQFHVQSPVALEHHAQEVNNVQGDFYDIAAVQETLHKEMLGQLTRWEGLTYRLLFIRHLSPADTAKELEKAAARRKGPLRTDELTSYASVLAAKRRFTDMMLLVLKHNGHIDPSYLLKR